jgi:hypothetical protein
MKYCPGDTGLRCKVGCNSTATWQQQQQEKRGWSSATAFAFDSYGYRVGEFDSRWSRIRLPLDKALCFSLSIWLDSASE